MRVIRTSSVLLAAAVALSVGLSSGCASSRRDVRDRAAPQPVLLGTTAFFGGNLIVEAELGPFRFDNTDPVVNGRPPGPGERVPVPVRNGAFGSRTNGEVGTGFPRGAAEGGAFGGPGSADNGRRPGPGLAGSIPRQSMIVRFRSQ